MTAAITLSEIRKLNKILDGYIYRTPLIRCRYLESIFSENTKIFAKLEFLQKTGTFKIRGAIASIINLNKQKKDNGVVAVSAGNHAIAVSHAAKLFDTNCKVVMPVGSNSFRVNCCKNLGAKVIFAKNSTAAFNLANEISESEKREFIHPFEGKDVISGTATLGFEIFNQCENMDSILIPIGGGGLAAGVSHAIKQSNKNIQVFGVEPKNANTMQISIKKNKVQSDIKINTIADSLAAPFSLPLSFDYCLNNLDQIVTVSDSQMRESIKLIYNQMNLAVEPACSITTAALLDPLRDLLNGKKIVLIMCGSNLNWSTYKKFYK